jgi:hypothetical protein
MKQKKLDLNAVRDSFLKQKEKKSGGGGNYLKLDANKTTIRLLPNFKDVEASPSARMRLHTYKVGGRLENALEWGWLAADEGFANMAVEAGKITNEQLALAVEYGDPFTKLATKFKDFDEEVPGGVWAKTVFLFNAVLRGDEDEVGILKMSQQLADMLGGVLEQFPEVFDPSEDGFDIEIKGNGKAGLARRYTGVTVVRKTREVGIENIEEKVKDLDLVVLSNIKDYRKKVDDLFTLYGDDVARFGLSATDFGE